MRTLATICCWVCLVMILPSEVHAQKLMGNTSAPASTVDTVKPIVAASGDTLKRRFYSRLPYYTIGEGFMTPLPLDTTLDGKQYYEPGQQAAFRYRNLGNLGLAHIPIAYVPTENIRFDVGLNQFDLYTIRRSNLVWYTLDQPFTNLFLLIGANREQSARVVHNQNIGRNFNFAFHFNRFASPGAYVNQSTSHNNFALTSRYEAAGGKYGLRMTLGFNSIRVEDNGGAVGTNIFADSSFTTASVIAMELDKANTLVRDFHVAIRQELRRGRSITFMLNDTTQAQKFFPDWVFYHELQIKNHRYEFTDNGPRESYYGSFFLDVDSLNFNVNHKQWGNRLGIQFGKVISADTSGAVYRNFLIDAYVEQQLNDVANNRLSEAFSGISLNVRVGDHPLSGKPFQYEGIANYQLIGYNAHDLYVSGRMGYKFKKAGDISAVASLRNAEQPWLYNHVSFEGFRLEQDLDKTQTLRTGLEYRLPKYRLSVGGYFYNITNYAYWDVDRLPKQLDGNVQLVVLEASHVLKFWDMGLENQVRVQLISNQTVLPLPLYWGRHTLYYEKEMFKKNLRGRIGVDVFYNTNYKAEGYFPLVGQFHLQNAETLKFYPTMDVFISAQVAELVVFLKMEHVNQGMFKENGYFNAYKYPALPRAFKFGLVWRFYS